MGYDTGTNTLYMYFPMPFASQGRIVLQSYRGSVTNNVWYEIKHKAFSGSFANVGNLKAVYTVQSHGDGDHTDIVFLDIEGSGQVVGIVDSRSRYLTWPFGRNHLEGDDRIYVDNSQTPAWQGTGTEDFYNGGWYFDQGPYTRPPSGHTFHAGTGDWDTWDYTAMYRMLVEDSIPFRKHMRFGLEHGFGWGDGTTYEGDIACTAEALVFYYYKPNTRMTLSDTLDVGNAASESGHGYVINTATWSGTNGMTYEGDDDQTTITDNGRAHKGYSQFSMAISSANQGVVLRRRSDQVISDRTADVYVDNVLVGRWYNAGGNGTHRWLDSDFRIPVARTSGKSSITIKVQFIASYVDWNEFRYQAYSILN